MLVGGLMGVSVCVGMSTSVEVSLGVVVSEGVVVNSTGVTGTCVLETVSVGAGKEGVSVVFTEVAIATGVSVSVND